MDDERVATLQKEMLEDLGVTKFCNIKVSPFVHEWNGVSFGLVTQAPEDEDEEWNVIAEPGDYMAFYPPWDGDYDT
jgi:hypothetical protein